MPPFKVGDRFVSVWRGAARILQVVEVVDPHNHVYFRYLTGEPQYPIVSRSVDIESQDPSWRISRGGLFVPIPTNCTEDQIRAVVSLLK